MDLIDIVHGVGEDTAHIINIAEDQFSREKDLIVPYWETPQCVIIIGLGGIGSNVAEAISTFKGVSSVIMIDPDIVEVSNIPRTAYNYKDLGRYKADVMSEKILSNNPTIRTLPIRELFNRESVKGILDVLIDREGFFSLPVSDKYKLVVFDCRDDDYQDLSILDQKLEEARRHYNITIKTEACIWRLAYNGISMTIDNHSENRTVFGRRGYTELPSYGLPSKLVAYLGVAMACSKEIPDNNNKIPLTFDIQDLLKYILIGQYIHKTDEKGFDELYYGKVHSYFDVKEKNND